MVPLRNAISADRTPRKNVVLREVAPTVIASSGSPVRGLLDSSFYAPCVRLLGSVGRETKSAWSHCSEGGGWKTRRKAKLKRSEVTGLSIFIVCVGFPMTPV